MGRHWTPLVTPGNPKVSLAIAAYNRHDPLFCLLYSLRSQTHENWEAVVMHDGPCPSLRELVQNLGDPRVRFVESPERVGQFGHPLRKATAEMCTGDFIGMSNDDNYYAPVYFEWMLHALTSTDADFAHCDMVHDYWKWCHFVTRPKKNKCDLGCWVARADLVKRTPWRDMTEAGDGTFVEDLVAGRKAVHVPGTLFVHN